MVDIAYSRFIGKPGNAAVLTECGFEVHRLGPVSYRLVFWLNRAQVLGGEGLPRIQLAGELVTELVPGSEKAGTELMHPRVRGLDTVNSGTAPDCNRYVWFTNRFLPETRLNARLIQLAFGSKPLRPIGPWHSFQIPTDVTSNTCAGVPGF